MHRQAVWTKRLRGAPGPDNPLPPGGGVRIGYCRFSWPYVLLNGSGFLSGLFLPGFGWLCSAFVYMANRHILREAERWKFENQYDHLRFRPKPGWYADPESRGTLRWWDGTIWTEERTVDPR